MGPIILALVSLFKLSLPETNPHFRKHDITEKRKRESPKKKFRPATPRVAMMCPPKDYLVTENRKEDTTIDTAKPSLKYEPKTEEQATSQKEEKCGWGPDCPFCKFQKKEGEDKQQQKPLPKPQAKRPDTLSLTKMRQQWEAEMERLNTKYNLHCFSDSDLDSESDEGK